MSLLTLTFLVCVTIDPGLPTQRERCDPKPVELYGMASVIDCYVHGQTVIAEWIEKNRPGSYARGIKCQAGVPA
jgi:hypothetical protein